MLRCPMCDGDGYEMGGLGNLVHYRCQDCGWNYNITAKQRDEFIGTHENDTGVVLESDYQPKGVPMKKIISRTGDT